MKSYFLLLGLFSHDILFCMERTSQEKNRLIANEINNQSKKNFNVNSPLQLNQVQLQTNINIPTNNRLSSSERWRAGQYAALSLFIDLFFAGMFTAGIVTREILPMLLKVLLLCGSGIFTAIFFVFVCLFMFMAITGRGDLHRWNLFPRSFPLSADDQYIFIH